MTTITLLTDPSRVRNVSRMQITMTPRRRTRNLVKNKTWNRRFFVYHKKNINVITVNSNIIIASSKAVEADFSFSRNFLGIFTIYSSCRLSIVALLCARVRSQTNSDTFRKIVILFSNRVIFTHFSNWPKNSHPCQSISKYLWLWAGIWSK